MRQGKRLITIMCLLMVVWVDVHASQQEEKKASKAGKASEKEFKGDLKKIGPDGFKDDSADELKLKLALTAADEGTFKFFGSKFVPGKVIKGAPYSATATTEQVQTLLDGNQIIRKNEAVIHRDAEGRTHVAQALGTIGKWPADGDPARMIYISDPVTQTFYVLDPRSKTAHKGYTFDTHGGKIAGMGTNGKFARGGSLSEEERRKVEAARDQLREMEERKAAMGNRVRKVGDPRRKTESLGKQVIEGVEVEGSRSTLTIPAGEIGNVLPIEVVEENWYSPDLQTMIMSKMRDPRLGESTYKLTNINRSDPDRSLFDVPADYTVVDPKEAKKKAPGARD